MVPMHQGLIDGPCVLHNLVSAQWSPVPLLKFQMAPKLKILMPSGSKKGTQMSFFPLLKVPAKELSPSSPAGPLMERDTCLQVNFHISKSTQKFLFIIFFLSKALRKSAPPYSPKAPLHVPQMQVQYGSRHTFPEP